MVKYFIVFICSSMHAWPSTMKTRITLKALAANKFAKLNPLAVVQAIQNPPHHSTQHGMPLNQKDTYLLILQ